MCFSIQMSMEIIEVREQNFWERVQKVEKMLKHIYMVQATWTRSRNKELNSVMS